MSDTQKVKWSIRLREQITKTLLKGDYGHFAANLAYLAWGIFTFLAIGYVLLARKLESLEGPIFKFLLDGFINIYASVTAGAVAIFIWRFLIKQRERDFRILALNYRSEIVTGAKGKLAMHLAYSIDQFLTENPKANIQIEKLDSANPASLRSSIVARLLGKHYGKIVIAPFGEVAGSLLSVLEKPNRVGSHSWNQIVRIEQARLFPVCVTYDPELTAQLARGAGWRFFSTPSIDITKILTEAAFDHRCEQLILVGDEAGDFPGVEKRLNRIIQDEIKIIDNIVPNFSKKVTEDLNRPESLKLKVSIFITSVDPSPEILEHVFKLINQFNNSEGELLRVYVFPSWFREWDLTNGKRFITEWFTHACGQKLTTALPYPALAAAKKSELRRESFDIIKYYLDGAMKFSIEMLDSIEHSNGVPLNSHPLELDQRARVIFKNADFAGYTGFSNVFANGEFYYTPLIVDFWPDSSFGHFTVNASPPL